VIVTPARLADVDTIMRWRAERTAWLRDRGEDQWSIPLPRTAIACNVSSGQTWMVWDGDEPVATLVLSAYTDFEELWKPDVDPEPLWLPDDDPGDALYVSKMMTPLDRSRAGLGAEMLRWAGGRAFDAGLQWLRLDAWTTNERLHAYYRARGFRHVRTVASRISGACFQRPAQPYVDGRLKTRE
jgi:GNAT superfamily N-acetyltransferase